MRIGPVDLLLEMPHRCHGVKHLAAGMSRARLGKQCDEARMIRAGERDHRVAIRVRRHAAAMFMRRAARGNEMDLVEVEAALRGARDLKVSNVDWIKRAAEQRNAALARMTSGSAVALRRGDAPRASLRGAAGGGGGGGG